MPHYPERLSCTMFVMLMKCNKFTLLCPDAMTKKLSDSCI